MKPIRRLLLLCCLGGAFGPVAAQQALAPIRLIVPTPAGGPSDGAARVVAQALAQSSGQNVVVENKPGAGGSIAAQAVMAAAPDGRTLLWTLASMTGIPMLQKSPPFQSLAELMPVTLIGHFSFGLFAHPELPVRSVADLVARSKAAAVDCAHGTLGEFMAAAQFMKASGTRLVLVPYKGGAQLMPDLLAGRVQVNFGPLSSGLQHVNAGKLRLMATLGAQRSPLAPDVPTLAESGVTAGPLPTWQALFAPPGTPAGVAERLARDVAAVLRDPQVKAQLEQRALQLDASGPAALSARIGQDQQLWRDFIQSNDIRPE
jgi:tripartite-type tricarboxylate transporter receptor subunit TctC